MNKFVITQPLISEKATRLSTLGKYVFLVDKKAAAPEIKKALEAIYKVNITDINVINIPPRPRRTGRYVSERPSYRKAIVTLKKGEKLDIMPH